MNGKFIVVEGLEGAGKSSVIGLIVDALKNAGKSVEQTREPGGTPLAEAIRRNLLSVDEEAPVEMAELLLVFAARAQHLTKVIEPALNQGQWVLCDRFTDATYAYQGAGRGLSAELIGKLESLVQGDRRPDTVILLDMPPEIGLVRARARGALDRFEQEEQAFFERVRQGYLERADQFPDRYVVVDAAQNLIDVQKSLEAVMTNWSVDE